MAEVRLGLYEMESGTLPRVCLLCGEPATTTAKEKLSARKMTIDVEVPMCAAHKNHWSRRVRLNRTYLGFVLCVLEVIVLYAVFSRESDKLSMILGITCFLITPLLIVWGIINAVFDATLIKPTEITERSIFLNGVSESFVAALTEARAKMPGKQNTTRDGDRKP